jgi:hypothetical protein
MGIERKQPDDGTDRLIELLDRYKLAVAGLTRLARGSVEHSAQLRVEEALSRQIHDTVTDQRRSFHD